MEDTPKTTTETEVTYRKAAAAVEKATFLLIGAGAGMSADSGLPGTSALLLYVDPLVGSLIPSAVYGDVSKLEFFQRTKLDYRDLCDPSLLVKNPERYFGWSAMNLTKYREACPHKGYGLLREWRDELFSATGTRELGASSPCAWLQPCRESDSLRAVQEAPEEPSYRSCTQTSMIR